MVVVDLLSATLERSWSRQPQRGRPPQKTDSLSRPPRNEFLHRTHPIPGNGFSSRRTKLGPSFGSFDRFVGNESKQVFSHGNFGMPTSGHGFSGFRCRIGCWWRFEFRTFLCDVNVEQFWRRGRGAWDLFDVWKKVIGMGSSRETSGQHYQTFLEQI